MTIIRVREFGDLQPGETFFFDLEAARNNDLANVYVVDENGWVIHLYTYICPYHINYNTYTTVYQRMELPDNTN